MSATVTGVNDLATKFPDVVAQWHPTKNGDFTPDHISGGSHRKMWWVCEKAHEWQATVSSRTYGGTGCPVCWHSDRQEAREHHHKDGSR